MRHNLETSRALHPWSLPVVMLLTVSAALGGCDGFRSGEYFRDKASTAMAAGDYPTASIQLKKALERTPEDGKARLMLAEVSLGLADPLAAKKEAERARDAGLPPEQWVPVMARVLRDLGDFSGLSQLLARNGSALQDAERELLQADVLAGQTQWDEAATVYARLLKAEPGNAAAARGLATTQVARGEVDAAIATLKPLANAATADARLLTLLGELQARSGDLGGATRTLEAARKRAEPKRDLRAYVSAAATLADLQLTRGELAAADETARELRKVAPRFLVARYVQARAALANGRTEEAYTAATEVVNAGPENLSARVLLAVVQLRMGADQQAESTLNAVLADHPQHEPARRLLAELLLRSGRADDAGRTLEPLVRGGTADATALALMGQIAAAGGNAGAARDWYERALSSGSASDALKLDLASAFISSGDSARGVEILESLQGGGTDLALRRDLMLAAARTGGQDPQKVKAAIDEVLARYGDQPTMQTRLALYDAANGGYDSARQRVAALLQKNDKDLDALKTLARIESLAGKPDAAEGAVRKWLDVRADDPEALLAMAELSMQRGDQAAARTWLERARDTNKKALPPRLMLTRAYLASGDVGQARNVAGELLAIAPNRADVQALAGLVELRAGNTEEAQRYAEKATELEPRSADAWLNRGHVQEAVNRPKDAIVSYRRAFELQPRSPIVASALVSVLLKQPDYPAALGVAQQLQRFDATRTAGFVLEGDIQSIAGKHPAAVAAYDRAVKLTPSGAIVVRSFVARRRAGEPAPERSLSQWLETHPDDALVRMALGEYLMTHGRETEAIQQYELGLVKQPDNPILLNNLALLYHTKRDPRAVSLARKAFDLAPNEPAIMDTLGWVLAETGAVKEGLSLLEKAAAGAPTQGDIQYHYAAARAKNGDVTAARQALTELLANPQPFALRVDAEALLQKLK